MLKTSVHKSSAQKNTIYFILGYGDTMSTQ